MQPDEIYRVLGVPRDADAATVKNAYRALAAKYHPDRNPSDTYAEQKFAEAGQAYAAWAATHEPAQAPGSARSAAPPGLEDIFGQFEQLFGDFFGRTGKSAPRGGDLVQPLRLSYVEARDGTKRTIEVARRVRCEACRATPKQPCTACTGTGKVEHQQGFFAVATVCATCAGTGLVAATACAACERGLARKTGTLDVTVPPGVTAGMKLRLPDKGDEHPIGSPGHLFLEIVIDNTNVLVRDGDHVTFETEVPGGRALLGGPLEVETLDGRAMIRVPAFVRDGAVITLAGKGHARAATSGGDPYRDVARGDQRVILRVSREAQLRRRQLVTAGVAIVVAVAIALLALI